MLTISKVFTTLCLLRLYENREYPGSFQNKPVPSSFKWLSKLFFPWPNWREKRKAFLEWTSIDLFSKLSLTCRGYVNYYKSAHHAIPTLPAVIGNTLAIFKQISKLSLQLSVQVYSLLGQTKEERRPFFGGWKKGAAFEITARALGCHMRWKSLSFYEI